VRSVKAQVVMTAWWLPALQPALLRKPP